LKSLINSNNWIACCYWLTAFNWSWSCTSRAWAIITIKVISIGNWIDFTKITAATWGSAKLWSATTYNSRSNYSSWTTATTWSNGSTSAVISFSNYNSFLRKSTSALNGLTPAIISFSNNNSFLRKCRSTSASTSTGWSDNCSLTSTRSKYWTSASTSWSFLNYNSFPSLAWTAISFLLCLFLEFSESMNLGLGIF